MAAKKGNRYMCSECGLVVAVEDACGCVDTCDIVCCDTTMKPVSKKKAVKKTAKRK